MKKLIATTMTLAVAFAASAGDLATPVGFEGSTGPYDIGGSPVYWKTRDSDPQLVVTAYASAAEKYAYTEGAMVSGGPGDNYLAIETSDPVYRTLVEQTSADSFTSTNIVNGLYIDTLVKFTATESLEVPDLAGGRLAIWLGTDADAQNPTTNLYVTAAAVDSNGTLTPTNFLVSSTIDPAAWHRLTVRAINDVNEHGQGELAFIGFTVFVDGVQVADQGSDYASLVDSNVIKANAVQSYVAAKQLFVGCTPGESLEAVGFKGTGSVDDIAFASYQDNNIPDFAKGDQSFTITWTPGEISALSINGTAVADLSTGTNVIAQLETNTVTLAVTYAGGYTGDTSIEVPATAGGSYTIEAQAAKFGIGTEEYATLADAVADASADDTITLLANVTEVLDDGIAVTQNIKFDLAGHNYAATAGAEAGIFTVSAGTLTIVDSVGTGSITVTGDAIVDIGLNGHFVAGSATGDLGATFNGPLAMGMVSNLSVVKGKFDKANNTDEGFAFEAQIANGGESDATTDNAYFLVGMGGGSSGSWADASSAANDATAATVWPALAGTSIASANAKKLARWASDASLGNIDLAAAGSMTTDQVNAFLLNCAVADLATEQAAFVVDITFDSEGVPQITTPANKEYNGTVTIQGSAAIPFSWHAQTTGDKFFKAVLSL